MFSPLHTQHQVLFENTYNVIPSNNCLKKNSNKSVGTIEETSMSHGAVLTERTRCSWYQLTGKCFLQPLHHVQRKSLSWSNTATTWQVSSSILLHLRTRSKLFQLKLRFNLSGVPWRLIFGNKSTLWHQVINILVQWLWEGEMALSPI